MNEQREPMNQGSPQQQASPNQSLISRRFATDNSGSNESCGTYITCKMTQLDDAAAEEFTAMTELAQRESISVPLTIIPSVQQYEYDRLPVTSHPAVVFLDSPKQVSDNPELKYTEPAEKRPRFVSPSTISTAKVALRCHRPVGATKGSQKRPNVADKCVTNQPPFANYTDL